MQKILYKFSYNASQSANQFFNYEIIPIMEAINKINGKGGSITVIPSYPII